MKASEHSPIEKVFILAILKMEAGTLPVKSVDPSKRNDQNPNLSPKQIQKRISDRFGLGIFKSKLTYPKKATPGYWGFQRFLELNLLSLGLTLTNRPQGTVRHHLKQTNPTLFSSDNLQKSMSRRFVAFPISVGIVPVKSFMPIDGRKIAYESHTVRMRTPSNGELTKNRETYQGTSFLGLQGKILRLGWNHATLDHLFTRGED